MLTTKKRALFRRPLCDCVVRVYGTGVTDGDTLGDVTVGEVEVDTSGEVLAPGAGVILDLLFALPVVASIASAL